MNQTYTADMQYLLHIAGLVNFVNSPGMTHSRFQTNSSVANDYISMVVSPRIAVQVLLTAQAVYPFRCRII
jgi:hypothetical protein